MYYLVEEMKGVAGVDERTIASEIVIADTEAAAIALARSDYGMRPEADEMNGAGRWNHYLMATALDIAGHVRRLGLADALRIEDIGDGWVRLNDEGAHVQGRADEIEAVLVHIPDGAGWDEVVEQFGAAYQAGRLSE